MKINYFKKSRTGLSLTLLLLIILSLGLAACGDASPTAVPTPDAKTLAKQAAQKLTDLNTLHFLIDIKEGEVPIIKGITFRRVEGDYVKPDRYQGKMRVGVIIGQVEGDIVAVGDDQYIKVKGLIDNWQKLPPTVGFKPADLFDFQKGLGSIVEKVRDYKVVKSEVIDGVDCWQVGGLVDGKDISTLTGGTLDQSQVEFNAWVGKSDTLMRQTTFKQVVTDNTTKAVYWVLSFSKFNTEMKIEKPAGV